jgi:hypothetical protein
MLVVGGFGMPEVLYTWLETDSVPAARGDERPDCIKPCWGEGGSPYDYAIYLPY